MPDSLALQILKKDKLALSKAISIVENRLPGYEEILSTLYSHRNNIHKIGITGPPGAGKSTITNKLSDFSWLATYPYQSLHFKVTNGNT